MADLLTKLKLKNELIIEFNSDFSQFNKLLKEKTESSDLDFTTEFFSALSFSRKISNKPFKGIILHSSFKLKQNISLNSFNLSTATAKGSLKSRNGILTVIVEISGIDHKMIPVCIFSFFIFMIAIGSLNIGNSEKAYIPESFVFFGFSLLPYLKMRWDTRRMAKKIRNEFELIKNALQNGI